jgi:secretion/DNA translocation related TadE-like protein
VTSSAMDSMRHRSVASGGHRLSAGRNRGVAGPNLGGGGLNGAGAGRDRGSATVWVLAAGMVMVLAALAVSTIGAAIVARHRAQQAADLAALAGAAYALTGEAAACARAAELVSLNGASLVSCRLDGPDLIVSAAIEPAGPPVLTRPATASARAGQVVANPIGLGEG